MSVAPVAGGVPPLRDARVAGAVLAMTAAFLYFGVASPLNSRAAALVQAHRQAREERREARVRLRNAELQDDVRRRAAALVRGSSAPSDEVARAVRGKVVGVLGGARDVSLSVTPDREAVRVQLSLAAGEEEAFALLGRLSAPSVGLILQDVRLARTERGVQVTVAGVAFGGGA